MSIGFWVKRFLTVLVGAFAFICIAQLLKGHSVTYSVAQAAIWGAATAVIFTVARFFQAKRGQHCAICKDTPEMQHDHRGEV